MSAYKLAPAAFDAGDVPGLLRALVADHLGKHFPNQPREIVRFATISRARSSGIADTPKRA